MSSEQQNRNAASTLLSSDRALHDLGDVLFVTRSIPACGYTARTVTPGPELEMVLRFIDCRIEKRGVSRGVKRVFFLEPHLDSGYPDLVVVYLGKQQHQASRELLNPQMAKILTEIERLGHTSIQELEAILACNSHTLVRMLSKLDKDGCIHFFQKSGTIRKAARRNYTRVLSIESFEAKIDKWSVAIDQAEANLRFADRSYVLMNKSSYTQRMEERCRDRGVDIALMNGSAKLVNVSQANSAPKTYVAHLLGAWAEWVVAHADA